MAENEMTTLMLAKKIGIAEPTLQVKITGGSDWRFWEILLIAKLFGYEDPREVFPELYQSILDTA